MKVFFIGATPISAGVGYADSMEAHIVAAFHELAVNCEYFPYLTTGLGRRLNRLVEGARTDFGWIRRTPVDRLLARRIKTTQPDLVLVLLGNYAPPTTIREIRRVTQASVVCWCQDHMGTLGRQYLIGARFDHVFSKDQVLVDLLQRFTRTSQAHYLPEACNPRVHHPVTPTPEEQQRFGCDVTTAANLYFFRTDILENLTEFDLRLWGSIPPFYEGPLRPHFMGRPVVAREKAACFSSARIVINTLHPMEAGGLNARAFEIAGCGGFQLITHSECVERHFVPGREIVTFNDVNELREKVRYYLDHDGERRAIAEAGRARAHAEHTYVNRLRRMFNVVLRGTGSADTSSLGVP